MEDKEYEQLILRAIKGDADALNELGPEISKRLEKEIENGNPFIDLLLAMFDPHFFDDKSKEDFINKLRNSTISYKL